LLLRWPSLALAVFQHDDERAVGSQSALCLRGASAISPIGAAPDVLLEQYGVLGGCSVLFEQEWPRTACAGTECTLVTGLNA